MYNEFVVEFKDGTRDWVDPVDWEDILAIGGGLVVSTPSYDYRYDLTKIARWTVRPYSEETTYDPIHKGRNQ